MGDTEQDGIHDELMCEITKRGTAENKGSTVVEYKASSRRTSLKIGLFVSIGLNVIFAVLFVVVFIMLSNMNARLSRFDDLLNKGQGKTAEVSGSNIDKPTDSSSSTEEPLVMLCFYT